MSIPYMPLFVADYEADTSHLSMEEDGCYTRLLRLCWRTPGCSIPDDDAWIARMLRADEETMARVVRPILAEFFKRRRARLFNPRQQREFTRIKSTSEKRSSAGAKGGQSRKSLNPLTPKPSPAEAKKKHLDLDLDIDLEKKERTPLPPKGGGVVAASALVAEFDRVWPCYPRHVGVGQARAAWVKARSKASFEEIANPLRAFIRACSGTPMDKTPHFATWLNGERWNDDQSHASNRTRTATEDIERLSTITAADDVARLFADIPKLRIAK